MPSFDSGGFPNKNLPFRVSVINKKRAPTNRVKSETFMWTRFLYAGVFEGKFGNYLASKFLCSYRTNKYQNEKI